MADGGTQSFSFPRHIDWNFFLDFLDCLVYTVKPQNLGRICLDTDLKPLFYN